MIALSKPLSPVNIALKLSGSKSISNRLLIISQVLGLNLSFENLANAEDTVLLQQALASISNNKSASIDIHHAGTDMRFLTALLAVTEGEWILTGSERLKQRPVGELVTALNGLGADIHYLENKNFAPLKIKGKKLSGGHIAIDGSVSSQFISALLMIASSFEKSLILTLTGELVSQPYIQMTIDLLKEYNVAVERSGNVITVPALKIQNSKFKDGQSAIKYIESDWSSASYWYSICALSPGSQIELRNFDQQSLQADSVLPVLFDQLGVTTLFSKHSVLLSHKQATVTAFAYDFTNCPDIAQTLAVTCFGLRIPAQLSGLKTLKIKETDRITALKTELEKFGAVVEITLDSLTISQIRNPEQKTIQTINTYNDHRMAMSFAPLALVYNHINIQNPSVVGKSYPAFWEDLKSAGFNVNLQP